MKASVESYFTRRKQVEWSLTKNLIAMIDVDRNIRRFIMTFDESLNVIAVIGTLRCFVLN